jgi:hypothetical protein
MSSNPREIGRRKLWGLWIGLVAYLVLILFAFRFASSVPYPFLIMGGIFNMAIIISFVVAISRAYQKMRQPTQSEAEGGASGPANKETYRRRIRTLWFGLGLYLLIILNSFRYFRDMPLWALMLGILINGAIIVAVIVALRRAYASIRK